jgi:hypothetical protein
LHGFLQDNSHKGEGGREREKAGGVREREGEKVIEQVCIT